MNHLSGSAPLDDLPADRPVAVVTGANRGIGLEVVRQCAAHEMAVVLGCRDVAKGRSAAQRHGLQERVLVRALDVTSQRDVDALAEELGRRFGRLDVLVNNAAIHYDTWQHGVSADLGVVTEALQTNLLGAWRTCIAFAGLLRRSRHARVVNVSSEAGSISEMRGGAPAYSVSKAALKSCATAVARSRKAVGCCCSSR